MLHTDHSQSNSGMGTDGTVAAFQYPAKLAGFHADLTSDCTLTHQRQYEKLNKQYPRGTHIPRIVAPDAIQQCLWQIPGLDLNYAPLAVFPPRLTHPSRPPSWQELSAGFQTVMDILRSALVGLPSAAELTPRVRRQIPIFTSSAVGMWYRRIQSHNVEAALWYSDLLDMITHEASTIREYEGPVLAIQFLVSLAAIKSVQLTAE